MPELPSRIDGEIIEAEHMNTVQDRAIQRVTSEAQRDSLYPAPIEGDTVWVADINQLQTWDGGGWRMTGLGIFVRLNGDTQMTGALQAFIGSETLPGVTFAGDPDTGMFQLDQNRIGFSTANTRRFDISFPMSTFRTLLRLENQLHALASDEAQLLIDGTDSARIQLRRSGVTEWWRFHIDASGVFHVQSSVNSGANWIDSIELDTAGTTLGHVAASSVSVDSGTIILHEDGSAEFNNGLVVDGYSTPPYTPQARNITASDIEPDPGEGKDGDVYIWYDNGGSNTGARVYVRVSGVWRGAV